MLTPRRSVIATLDDLSLLSSGMKSEPRNPRVKFEPAEPVVPMKRLSFIPKEEANQKRFKFENEPKIPLNPLTNSPSSSPSRAPQDATVIRSRLSDIQPEIISARRLLDNVRRKTRKSAADRTREARFVSIIKRLEDEKRSLSSSLPASNTAQQLERKLSLTNAIQQRMPIVTASSGVLSTPKHRHMPGNFAMSSSPQPVASGSSDVPMDVDNVFTSYTAKADE